MASTKRGTAGNLVVKRSRGKMATTVKNGGTVTYATRGKSVNVEANGKRRIMTGKTSNYERSFGKSDTGSNDIKRRGTTAKVLKRVRSR
jgi:hypothetical protein